MMNIDTNSLEQAFEVVRASDSDLSSTEVAVLFDQFAKVVDREVIEQFGEGISTDRLDEDQQMKVLQQAFLTSFLVGYLCGTEDRADLGTERFSVELDSEVVSMLVNFGLRQIGLVDEEEEEG